MNEICLKIIESYSRYIPIYLWKKYERRLFIVLNMWPDSSGFHPKIPVCLIGAGSWVPNRDKDYNNKYDEWWSRS